MVIIVVSIYFAFFLDFVKINIPLAKMVGDQTGLQPFFADFTPFWSLPFAVLVRCPAQPRGEVRGYFT